MVMSSGQANAEITCDVSPTLNLNHDGAPIAFTCKDYGNDAYDNLSPTLRSMNNSESHANGGGQVAVAFAIQAGALRTNPDSSPDGVGVQPDQAYTLEARAEVQAVCITGDVTHTLKGEGFDASEDGTGRGQPIVAHTLLAKANSSHDESKETYVTQGVSIRGRDGGATAELSGEISTAIRASQGGGDKPHVMSGMSVRRLTPRECERLQDFPDDFTMIPWRGKPAEQCPDGPRYKALGNSMAVCVMRWLGERIEMVEAELCRTTASSTAMTASADTGFAPPAAKSARLTS